MEYMMVMPTQYVDMDAKDMESDGGTDWLNIVANVAAGIAVAFSGGGALNCFFMSCSIGYSLGNTILDLVGHPEYMPGVIQLFKEIGLGDLFKEQRMMQRSPSDWFKSYLWVPVPASRGQGSPLFSAPIHCRACHPSREGTHLTDASSRSVNSAS